MVVSGGYPDATVARQEKESTADDDRAQRGKRLDRGETRPIQTRKIKNAGGQEVEGRKDKRWDNAG